MDAMRGCERCNVAVFRFLLSRVACVGVGHSVTVACSSRTGCVVFPVHGWLGLSMCRLHFVQCWAPAWR